MIGIKNNKRVFFRAMYISAIAVFCLIFGFFGAAKAYENTVRIGFGEYKKAVNFENGKLRIFDLEIEILKSESK